MNSMRPHPFPVLQNGDIFPALSIDSVGGGQISLPGDLAGAFGVVLIYRGSWCPYCVAQLTGFAQAAGELAELGVKLVALSADDGPSSNELATKLRLPFPIGFGADVDLVRAVTGAYINAEPRYLQSTGFVLDPEGKLMTAVYSSLAIGRLVAGDVIGFIRYVKSKS